MDIRRLLVASFVLLAALPGAQAQSTDGYHAIQVFPVVVDTASFKQRFHLQGADPWGYAGIEATYYPAQGTAPGAPHECVALTPPSEGEASFASLRDICPGLPAGSLFGALVLHGGMLFSGTSRVSNTAGAGFVVEAFPAHGFTSAVSSVTGLRRLAASGGQPAYQTNCFVGNLAELGSAPAATTTTVTVSVRNAGGALLGTTAVAVAPGQLVRLLDVFAAVGAPAANVDDAVASFSPGVDTGAALMSFCTVQDNTSFSADFRIGKQQYAYGDGVGGPRDEIADRFTVVTAEEPIDGATTGTPLAIPPGATRNVHSIYFRHPDEVGCLILDQGGAAAPATYGLELRLRVLDPDGWRVLAGGNDATQFQVFLGDKPSHGGGANTRYQVEVESNGLNTAASRPYRLHCYSGSGHTRGELLRKELPTAF
jgi:hypothetical protein